MVATSSSPLWSIQVQGTTRRRDGIDQSTLTHRPDKTTRDLRAFLDPDQPRFRRIAREAVKGLAMPIRANVCGMMHRAKDSQERCRDLEGGRSSQRLHPSWIEGHLPSLQLRVVPDGPACHPQSKHTVTHQNSPIPRYNTRRDWYSS